MKLKTNQFLFLLLGLATTMAMSSCQDNSGETCGTIDLLFDDIRYDVNTCEDLNFRNGCDYTIDYLNLCYEEGGTQYCQEVSIAFVSLLNEGEYNIVHPEAFKELTPGGNYITGYIGQIGNDELVVPMEYMESGLLTVTAVDLYNGTVTGTFEFKVKMGGEDSKYIEASGTFQNVRW